MDADTLARCFEGHRPHLLSVAYRLTGSVADAEDAVQDAWLRLDRAGDPAEIEDLRAWLTTVVGRLCLDHLRSAAVRREKYVGQWLPEPIVTPLSGARPQDPLDAVVRDEDNRLAALVVLDTLGPDQRVAFVLHDGFGVPFAEIAAVLGISAAAARQSASRARRIAEAAPVLAPKAEHDAGVQALLAAVASGEVAAVVRALHPDARFIGDAGGTSRTAPNILTGPDHVGRFLLGLTRMYGADDLLALEPVLVNGQLGLLHRGRLGDPATGRREITRRVVACAVRDGVVWAGYDMVNPAKLGGVRL
ncbi:RNA polymerase sigma factor SigJ [Tomitella biformata]|uniref:RNA polymerase sigma factor SigJ n=1 Tax=Tomitella biformata TaxID=630403 RepID=UPI0004BAAFB2|nr:RNA polymerase sigma factor SigJ [Tomitella biformata]